MSFNPQYSVWSKEDFSTTGELEILHPSEFNIAGGVTRLIPNNFSQGVYTFNLPWHPVTGWEVQNSMDSAQIVSQDFATYTYNDGSYGNIGNVYQTAYYTSGDGSSFIYIISGQTGNQLTVEFDVRVDGDTINLTGGFPDTGNARRHGVYIGTPDEYAFIEVLPQVLRIDGLEEYSTVSDFNSRLRKVRIAKSNDDLSIMLDNEQNVFINSGFISHNNTGNNSYILFGSFPQGTGFHIDPGADFPEITLASSSFSGLTLWDNIKINEDEAIIYKPEDFFPAYPTGIKQINTGPWKISPSVQQGLGAYIKVNPISGGYTRLTFEQWIPSGEFGQGMWAGDASVEQITVQEQAEESYFFDLTNVNIYNYPFENRFRFVIESESLGGAVPEVDEITFVGKPISEELDTIPNWKMSNMGKDIYFLIDTYTHVNSVPQQQYQDEIFIANKNSTNRLSLGYTLAPILGNNVTGQIVLSDGSRGGYGGLFKVEDGVYGDAWRSFKKHDEYVGIWNSTTTDNIDYLGQYQGEVLDIYAQYPLNGHPETIDQSQVFLEVENYQNLNGEITKVQKVIVSNYTGNYTDHIGVAMSGIYCPITGESVIGYVEGIIQIPRGPGVKIALHDRGEEQYVYLNGEDYRRPKPFGCVAYYTGDYSSTNSDSYISIGASARDSSRNPSSEYGDWLPDINEHSSTEFKIFSIYGALVSNSYLDFSGGYANFTRNIEPLNDIGYINYEDGLLTFSGFNENVNTLDPGEATFTKLETDAPLFEGWFRIFGINSAYTDTKVTLAELRDDSDVGLLLELDRNGKLYATVDTQYSTVSGGIGGIVSEQHTVQSEINNIVWGDWNHIGFVLENKAFGDIETNTFMPLAPTPLGHLEIPSASRSSRIYLTVNGEIAGSKDVAGSSYNDLFSAKSSLNAALTYPSTLSTTKALPKIPRMRHSNEWNIKIGEKVLCDYDHVRFGVKDRAECLSDLIVKGSKALPPRISPSDAIKPFVPTTGSVSHIELAHIYRLDEESDYIGLDYGFATNHAAIVGYSGSNDIQGHGLNPKFWIKKVDSPYSDRTAIRIGPGARLESTWSAFDERVFNGSGSQNNVGVRLYESIADIDYLSTGDGYSYERYTSNSHIKMSSKVRAHKYPTDGVMDILTFDYSEDPDLYGHGQAYLGLNTSGYVVCGTRTNFTEDIGRFTTTGLLQLDTWYNVGIDIKLPNIELIGDTGNISIYINGEEELNEDIFGITGWTPYPHTGNALGYGGIAEVTKSIFRLGGDVPRDGTEYEWTYRYGDFDVCDWVIGYGIDSFINPDVSQWNWAELHTDTDKAGMSEAAYANGNYIGPVSGTNNYVTGQLWYPATSLDDSGEQILWITANGGYDYAGPLRAGMPMLDSTLFMNAFSYYINYEDDNAAQILGTTDSPIQILNTLPPNAVNLALINIPPWSSTRSVSTFDMSDRNPFNLTPKINGDLKLGGFTTGNLGMVSVQKINSEELRVGSTSLYELENPNIGTAYFMHLIGGDSKAVHIQNAINHSIAASNVDYLYENKKKIKSSIKLTNNNGVELSFDEFKHDFIVVRSTPHGPDQINKNFTVILIAEDQSINESVFINYPSATYQDGTINLQDFEVYNPVPIMKKHIQGETAISGYFSIKKRPSLNGYEFTVMGGSFDFDYKTDNQGDL